MVELTEFLVKKLVSKPDMVSIKQFDDNEEAITIQVLVDPSDMKYVIGKNGRIAKAIRTVVRTSSYMNNLPYVKINIDSF